MSTVTSPLSVPARIARGLAASLDARRYAMVNQSVRFSFDEADQTLRVAVPSRFVADWFGRSVRSELEQVVAAEVGPHITLDVHVEAEGFRAPTTAAAPVAAPAPRRDEPAPDARPSILRHRLEDFVVGASNELAFAAASRIAEEAVDAPHPLFLHGGCGLGKTHLLQAVCAHILARRPDAKVHYTTGEQFTNDYITAVRTNRIDAFRRRIRSLELLAVDDVHFIANKQATQQEFLHSFDQIELGGARVILASDCHPKLIKQFSAALVSRCVRGLVVQVHKPDAATRVKLVEVLAKRRNIVLAPGVAQTIAAHCDGSVREIEGTLTKLQALLALDRTLPTQQRGEPIGHVVVRRLFDHDLSAGSRPRKPVRFDAILGGVAEHLGVTTAQVLGSSRHRQVVLARSMVIHLARELTTMSYPEIAAAMDRPNHSTIITAAQRVTKMLAANEPMLLQTHDGSSTPTTPKELLDELRHAVTSRAA